METQQQGRTLYVVLALGFAALIVGGATWFYMKDKSSSRDSAANTETPVAQTTVETASATTAQIDGSLTELDDQLAAIDVDEESEDDTVDF